MADQNPNRKLPPNFNQAINGTMDAIHRVLGGNDVENLNDLAIKFNRETESLLSNSPTRK